MLNLITSAATITPATEATAYPATNLYDRQAARVYRSTSASAISLLIDMGVAVSCDTVAIINHNLTAASSILLKAGATSPPASTVAAPVYRQRDIWKAFTPTAARYWLLTIAGTAPAAIQIGQLVLGTRVELPRARRIGGFTPATERFNIASETYAGVNYAYPVYQRKRFDPTFRVLDSELVTMNTFDQVVTGNARPFVYVPDVTAADVYYVRKEMSFEPREFDKSGAGIVYDYQMVLVEESRGLEVAV